MEPGVHTPVYILSPLRGYGAQRIREYHERVIRIAEISKRNRSGAENVAASAREQASALRELEGATHELRNLVIYLGDLTRRITSVS